MSMLTFTRLWRLAERGIDPHIYICTYIKRFGPSRLSWRRLRDGTRYLSFNLPKFLSRRNLKFCFCTTDFRDREEVDRQRDTTTSSSFDLRANKLLHRIVFTTRKRKSDCLVSLIGGILIEVAYEMCFSDFISPLSYR